jgi:hypothetical protein
MSSSTLSLSEPIRWGAPEPLQGQGETPAGDPFVVDVVDVVNGDGRNLPFSAAPYQPPPPAGQVEPAQAFNEWGTPQLSARAEEEEEDAEFSRLYVFCSAQSSDS